MSNAEAVRRWRINTKQRMLDAMGGKCQICSYDRSTWALEFHHIESEEKEFTFARIMANPIAWPRIVAEVKKCILLCANCHREVHDGVTELPEQYQKFDSRYEDYRNLVKSKKCCKTCSTPIPDHRTFCSNECKGKAGRHKAEIMPKKVTDWTKLEAYIAQGMSNVSIGKALNCTEAAVRKRRSKSLV